MKNVSIIAFTPNGNALACRLKDIISGNVDIFDRSIKPKQYVTEKFLESDTIIFIGAIGIAIRMIDGLIKSKDVDPAVIVLDELGKYVIPILSGHLGGANEVATMIGEKIGAEPVITTATDINNKFAVDVWTKEAGCKISDISKIKDISAAVLRNEQISICCGFQLEGPLPEPLTLETMEVGICVGIFDNVKPFNITLNAIPQIITLGVGCRRDTDPQIFEKLILKVLAENNISILALEKIASITLKKDEKCILDFCEKYKIPFVTYTAEELEQLTGNFTSSQFVKKITGVDNVCERSAVMGSNKGNIILSRTTQNGVTISLAKKDWKCKF
ncbi:MAG: cobalamin biosynthesis protein [Anaerovoracaceae bacterium]